MQHPAQTAFAVQPVGHGCPATTQGGIWMTLPWQVPLVHSPKQHCSVVPHAPPSWLQHRPFFPAKVVALAQQCLQSRCSEGDPFLVLRKQVRPSGRHFRLCL